MDGQDTERTNRQSICEKGDGQVDCSTTNFIDFYVVILRKSTAGFMGLYVVRILIVR